MLNLAPEVNSGDRVLTMDLAPKVPSSIKDKTGAVRRRTVKERFRDLLTRSHRNPVIPDITDIQPWMYYDRLTAGANTSPGNLLFFTIPMSNTKTKLDTNLKQAGRLPDPKHFVVMAIRFVFSSDTLLSDIQLMIKNYYIEFEIGDKIFAEGHLDTYPGGAGVYGAVGVATTAAATTATISVLNNGYPSPLAVNDWGREHAIHIEQGQTFQVRALAPNAVNLATAGTGLNLRCYLDGILYREAQ